MSRPTARSIAANSTSAEEILKGRFGFYRPPGGFFLWLDVGDGEAAALKLWREAALRSLPGAYIGRAERARRSIPASIISASRSCMTTTPSPPACAGCCGCCSEARAMVEHQPTSMRGRGAILPRPGLFRSLDGVRRLRLAGRHVPARGRCWRPTITTIRRGTTRSTRRRQICSARSAPRSPTCWCRVSAPPPCCCRSFRSTGRCGSWRDGGSNVSGCALLLLPSILFAAALALAIVPPPRGWPQHVGFGGFIGSIARHCLDPFGAAAPVSAMAAAALAGLMLLYVSGFMLRSSPPTRTSDGEPVREAAPPPTVESRTIAPAAVRAARSRWLRRRAERARRERERREPAIAGSARGATRADARDATSRARRVAARSQRARRRRRQAARGDQATEPARQTTLDLGTDERSAAAARPADRAAGPAHRRRSTTRRCSRTRGCWKACSRISAFAARSSRCGPARW